jgi:hypothetical protein
MLNSLSYIFLLIGVLSFAYGFRKINRNWMLVGAIFLTMSGGIEPFAKGVTDGYNSVPDTPQK